MSGRGLLCFPRTPVNAPLIRLAAVYRNGLVLETGTACSWHQSRVRSEHISMAGAEIKRLTPGTIGPGQRQDSPRVPGFLLLLGWPLIAVDASQMFPLARVPPPARHHAPSPFRGKTGSRMYCATQGIQPIFCNSCKWKATFENCIKNLKEQIDVIFFFY